MQEIKNTLSKGVNYWWLVLSLFIGLISHISRTIRWQMLIEPIEKKTNIINTFFAVMVGYFANLLIPRMGEISRCGVLSRYENISVSRLIGTVVVERLIDIFMLFICLILVLLLQYNIVIHFLSKNTDLTSITSFFTSPWTFITIFMLIGVLLIFKKWFSQSSPYRNIKGIWSKFTEGFLAIKNIKSKGLFIFHTIIIWILYFLMIYLNFFGFTFTSHLSVMAGISVFVLGSLGMVAPVQGGMGPWHYMVISSLQMYGIEKNEAAAFALIVWSTLNAMIVIIGIISLILLPVLNKPGRKISN